MGIVDIVLHIGFRLWCVRRGRHHAGVVMHGEFPEQLVEQCHLVLGMKDYRGFCV
ncbi:hypothetical protein SDC9_161731 [bioreactor metagenome]|uniref:Uncharacterized protein n=1 Tax=bioreactor metagenome TaxID=1076179 RepID=A0A645FQ86_9ZZZZ